MPACGLDSMRNPMGNGILTSRNGINHIDEVKSPRQSRELIVVSPSKVSIGIENFPVRSADKFPVCFQGNCFQPPFSLLKSKGIATGFQNVAVMSNAIQQRRVILASPKTCTHSAKLGLEAIIKDVSFHING